MASKTYRSTKKGATKTRKIANTTTRQAKSIIDAHSGKIWDKNNYRESKGDTPLLHKLLSYWSGLVDQATFS